MKKFMFLTIVILAIIYSCEEEQPIFEPEIKFNTKLKYGSLTDYDGNVYKTIKIGEQTWMAENLKVTHYSDGRELLLCSTDNEWWQAGGTLPPVPRYCWYNYDTINRDIYGGLYSVPTALNRHEPEFYPTDIYTAKIQGVCPTGWHIPSNLEWETLKEYVTFHYGESALKEVGNKHWYAWDSITTNQSGFTALPGGAATCATSPLYTSYWITSSKLTGGGHIFRTISYNSNYNTTWRTNGIKD